MNFDERQLLHEAIVFATRAHKGQLRKGTDLDYISHPLEVLQILTEMQAPLEVLIAGILHDTIEDTPVTLAEITEHFGEKTAALVAAHSEDKSKSWKERKQQTIIKTTEAPLQVKLMVAADKISNLRSMAHDYQEAGDHLWKRFHATKQEIAWYYSGVQDGLSELQNYENTSELYWEMVDLFKALFVFYYLDADKKNLYQTDSNSAYCLTRGNMTWQEIDTPGLLKELFYHPQNYTELSQKEAEALEDQWETQHKANGRLCEISSNG